MKPVVEECLALNVGDLTRAGVFEAPLGTVCNCVWTDANRRELFRIYYWVEGPAAEPGLRVRYQTGDSGSGPVSYRIDFAFVPCHMGGAKRLFLCPGKVGEGPCGRRAQKLYLIQGRWICRACGNLTYDECRKHDRRKDALLRDPVALGLALESTDWNERLLGVGAYAEAVRRLRKYGS